MRWRRLLPAGGVLFVFTPLCWCLLRPWIWPGLPFEPGWEWIILRAGIWIPISIWMLAVGLLALLATRLWFGRRWRTWEGLVLKIVGGLVLAGALFLHMALGFVVGMRGTVEIHRLPGGTVLLLRGGLSPKASLLRLRGAGESPEVLAWDYLRCDPPFDLRLSPGGDRLLVVGRNDRLPGGLVIPATGTLLGSSVGLPPLEELRAEFGADLRTIDRTGRVTD